jgi:nitroreductase
MIKDLITRNRSYRRFYQNHKLSIEELKDLVELARLSADEKTNQKVFSTLAWAAYLKDWDGPEEGERPTGYIVILGDTRLTHNYFCDHGIAAQSMLLGAVEKELGGCIFASIQRKKLKQLLKIEEYFEVLFVIALGKPKENVPRRKSGASCS